MRTGGGDGAVRTLRVGRCEQGGIFKNSSPGERRCPRRAKLLWGQAAAEESLTGVVGDGARQAEPENLPEGDGGKDGVGTTVEVANSIEPFDGHG
jgi:hypothetical protein